MQESVNRGRGLRWGAVAEITLVIGATARWGNGASGRVRSLVVGPRGYNGWPVTHLVVEPLSAAGPARLVPYDQLDHVETATDELVLNCTDEAFETLSAGENLPDEEEEDTGDRVHAIDGAIGHLRGLRVDQDLGTVVEVLIVGDLAVPVDQVSDFDGGVHLGVSKRAARNSD
jgi:hypothetical protein